MPRNLTCTVWTWGDWMTDDCADWITPWTWKWPPGSCTTATEPPSDIYKNTNINLNPQNTIYLSWQLHSIYVHKKVSSEAHWDFIQIKKKRSLKWLTFHQNYITHKAYSYLHLVASSPGDSFGFYVLGIKMSTTDASSTILNTMKESGVSLVFSGNWKNRFEKLSSNVSFMTWCPGYSG